MREMSLHILDIAENALDAGATLIGISISEEKKKDLLTIALEDNGCGIEEKNLEKVLDPFYTTRRTRRVGLGLSLFRETSRRCGGDLNIRSDVGKGTRVEATFRPDHIDLPPMGDMGGCIGIMIMGHPEVDIVYVHQREGAKFDFDTREIKTGLQGVAINHPGVLKYLMGVIRESEAALSKSPADSLRVDQEN